MFWLRNKNNFLVRNLIWRPVTSQNTYFIFFQPNANPYNLALDYDELYPAMFNIILWMMILLGIAFFAVSYGIWNMDPGRDSIIYRMTTTRLKKD